MKLACFPLKLAKPLLRKPYTRDAYAPLLCRGIRKKQIIYVKQTKYWRLPEFVRVGFSAFFGKSRAQKEQFITAENGLTSCRSFEWGKRSVIGVSKPSIAARKCPSTPDSLVSILPEVGLAILTCELSKSTNSSMGLKAIGVVSLISHLAQGIKKSLRLWMSRPGPVPGSPLEANRLVSQPIKL